VLRDVRTIIESHPESDRDALSEHVAELVALIVTEVAVLDRETDAGAVALTYAPLIAQALGWEVEPWRALHLWMGTAPAPLAAFGEAWARHMERAARQSESRHRHVYLVDLAVLSARLSLTRPRIRAIFAKEKCALEPVRMSEPSFTPVERREIRELARRMGYSRDHVAKLACDPIGFCNLVLEFEIGLLPEAQIAPHRGLKDKSDAQVTKSLRDRRYRLKRTPGPAASEDAIARRVEELARQKRVSVRTVWNWIERGASAAPLTSGDVETDGLTETEAQLARIAIEVPRHSKRQTAIDPEVLDLLMRWKTATTGKAPASTAWIRKTRERHGLDGLVATARQWEADNEFLKQEQRLDAIWEAHALPRVRHDDHDSDHDAARPVLGADDDREAGAEAAPRGAEASHDRG